MKEKIYKYPGVEMSKKEIEAYKKVGKKKQSRDDAAFVSPLILASVALLLLLMLFWLLVFSRQNPPHNVAIPLPQPTEEVHYVRFLCLTNGERLLPHKGVTWQRENGQVVDDVTDETGCVLIPADEQIGIFNHVHQVTMAIWPGQRPVCQDIVTGIVQSGNLCPPGQWNWEEE